MTAVLIRIALRYAAGALVVRGYMGAEDAANIMYDPDIQMAIGAALAAVSEGWFFLARRFGWAQ